MSGVFGGTVPLADMPPIGEAKTATAGAGDAASRMDHQHPRLTSAASGLLTNASGELTIVFTRTFDTKPAMDYNYVETPDAQPVVFKTKSWTLDGNGKYIGCIAKAYRSSLVTIAVLGVGVNAFSGNVANIEFSYIALQQS